MQAHQSKNSIGGSTSRDREMCVCSFYFRQFFYSGNSSTYFKVCVDLCKKKFGRTRCQAVSILEYNTNWTKSAERAKTRKNEIGQ